MVRCRAGRLTDSPGIADYLQLFDVERPGFDVALHYRQQVTDWRSRGVGTNNGSDSEATSLALPARPPVD